MEEAKLQRQPAEKELARQVIVVVGAGSGIGKELAHRLVKDGAHIVCVDLNLGAAQATAKEITDKYGIGIWCGGRRSFRLRSGAGVWRAISLTARVCAPCWTRLRWRTAALIPSP